MRTKVAPPNSYFVKFDIKPTFYEKCGLGHSGSQCLSLVYTLGYNLALSERLSYNTDSVCIVAQYAHITGVVHPQTPRPGMGVTEIKGPHVLVKGHIQCESKK